MVSATPQHAGVAALQAELAAVRAKATFYFALASVLLVVVRTCKRKPASAKINSGSRRWRRGREPPTRGGFVSSRLGWRPRCGRGQRKAGPRWPLAVVPVLVLALGGAIAMGWHIQQIAGAPSRRASRGLDGKRILIVASSAWGRRHVADATMGCLATG